MQIEQNYRSEEWNEKKGKQKVMASTAAAWRERKNQPTEGKIHLLQSMDWIIFNKLLQILKLVHLGRKAIFDAQWIYIQFRRNVKSEWKTKYQLKIHFVKFTLEYLILYRFGLGKLSIKIELWYILEAGIIRWGYRSMCVSITLSKSKCSERNVTEPHFCRVPNGNVT